MYTKTYTLHVNQILPIHNNTSNIFFVPFKSDKIDKTHEKDLKIKHIQPNFNTNDQFTCPRQAST